MRGYEYRKRQEARLKRKALFVWYVIWDEVEPPTDQWVGVWVSTHGRRCSCYMCTEHKRVKSRQELKSDLYMKEWDADDT